MNKSIFTNKLLPGGCGGGFVSIFRISTIDLYFGGSSSIRTHDPEVRHTKLTIAGTKSKGINRQNKINTTTETNKTTIVTISDKGHQKAISRTKQMIKKNFKTRKRMTGQWAWITPYTKRIPDLEFEGVDSNTDT